MKGFIFIRKFALLLTLVQIISLFSLGITASAVAPKESITGSVFEDFENISGWKTNTNAALSIDTSKKVSGNASLKLKSLSPGKVIYAQKSFATVDLSQVKNIEFNIYVPNLADIIYMNFYFTTSSGNYYYGEAGDWELMKGWNKIRKTPSKFFTVGSPSWSNITQLEIEVYATENKSPELNFDKISFNSTEKSNILFTFDDASAGVSKYAMPIMDARGMKGTTWANQDLATSGDSAFMNETTLKELYANGWDIGNHTVHHPDDISKLTTAQKTSEYKDNQDWLESIGMIRSARHVCYPMGSFDDELLSILRLIGVKSGRTTIHGIQPSPVEDIFRLKCIDVGRDSNVNEVKAYIDDAVNTGSSIFFMFHDVAITPNPNTEAGAITISTAKFTQIVDYVNALKNRNIVQVPTISQWFDWYNYDQVPTATPTSTVTSTPTNTPSVTTPTATTAPTTTPAPTATTAPTTTPAPTATTAPTTTPAPTATTAPTPTATTAPTTTPTPTTANITIDGNVMDWAGISAISSSNRLTGPRSLKVTNDSKYLYFLVEGNTLKANYEILINSDNNINTGYKSSQFTASGCDYMIETGGDIFYTTTNVWPNIYKGVSGVTVKKTATALEVRVLKSALINLKDTITLGYFDMTSTWSITSQLPASGAMTQYKMTTYTPTPSPTIVPTITPIPTTTATATATPTISPTSTSTNSPTPSPTPSPTNSPTPSPTATPTNSPTPSPTPSPTATPLQNSITVDGNVSDWAGILPQAVSDVSSGAKSFKVTTDINNLYFLIEGTNLSSTFDILINSDNNPATGCQVWGFTTSGCEYNIESDGHLYSSNGTSWPNISMTFDGVKMIKGTQAIEVSVPKTSIVNLKQTITLGYLEMDGSWNTINKLPKTNELFIYNIK